MRITTVIYRYPLHRRVEAQKGSFGIYHCRQRAPVGNALSSSGTSQLGMFDIQTQTKSKYYDHIVLLYLESRKCRKGLVYFNYTYKLLFIALFDDFNLIISIFHCLCPSFYPFI
jgi:hypothetical protein